MPFPLTVRDDVDRTAPLQVASSGPKREKVMVPVGLSAPASTAVALICPSTTVAGDAVVRSVGPAGVTVLAALGSRQAVIVTARWLASPE